MLVLTFRFFACLLIVSGAGRTNGPSKGQGHPLSCFGQLKTSLSNSKGDGKKQRLETMGGDKHSMVTAP